MNKASSGLPETEKERDSLSSAPQSNENTNRVDGSEHLPPNGLTNKANPMLDQAGSTSNTLYSDIWFRAVVSIVLFIIAGVLLLSLYEVSDTRISLKGYSDNIEIKLPQETQLDTLLYKDIQWTGKTLILLPDGKEHQLVYFEIIPDASINEAITVSNIVADKHSKIRLSTDTHANVGFLEIDKVKSPINVVIPEGARLFAQYDQDSHEENFKEIYHNNSGGIDVIVVNTQSHNLAIAGNQYAETQSLLRVKPINFLTYWKIENEGTVNEIRLNTIRSGILVLEELGGKRLEFWDGEPIHFKGVNGTIRALEIENSLIKSQYDGLVKELDTGYQNETRSLMPSMLAWLTHIPVVKALLSVFVVLVGMSLPKWRKK